MRLANKLDHLSALQAPAAYSILELTYSSVVALSDPSMSPHPETPPFCAAG